MPIAYLDAAVKKGSPVQTLVAILKTLRALRPDLLLTYNWGSIEWAAVNRLWPIAPHIHLESGFGPEEANAQLPRRVIARRLALARARKIIVPSENLVRIATEIWRMDRRRVVLRAERRRLRTLRRGTRPHAGAGHRRRLRRGDRRARWRHCAPRRTLRGSYARSPPSVRSATPGC